MIQPHNQDLIKASKIGKDDRITDLEDLLNDENNGDIINQEISFEPPVFQRILPG